MVVNRRKAWDHSLVLGPDCAESRPHPVAEHLPQRALEAQPQPTTVVTPQVFRRKGRQAVPGNYRHGNRHPPRRPFWNEEATRIPTTADDLESFLQFLLGGTLSNAKRLPGSGEHLEHDNPLQTPCFHVARCLGDDPGSSSPAYGWRRTLRLKVFRKPVACEVYENVPLTERRVSYRFTRIDARWTSSCASSRSPSQARLGRHR